ncbi:Phosphopantetheine attachment site [Paraburkholderia caribensis MBA4]|uniref:Phosphopantetheine attachment site n=1 Tax=Paraburkholderia caribensis MBA4 TaxID=1323664 RepID=A0A0P0RG78_9BURK|nr:acyl carrier protein [Paraburkholderia caribensis]ALL67690.1 Phosphopantetheine attachment site [Paraburkholderia caribensis MBA4]
MIPAPAIRALIEQELIAIAKSVMHKNTVEMKSSLFEQGLTSLGALEIRTRLESRFQISLRSSIVFDYPTLTDLTTFTTGVLGETDAASAVPGAPSDDKHTLEEALVRDILKKRFGV